jgi:hypothetical protein
MSFFGKKSEAVHKPTELEVNYSEKERLIKEKSRELFERSNAITRELTGLESELNEILSQISSFSGEDADHIEKFIEEKSAKIQENIAIIEEDRALLLAEWETTVLEMMSMYDVSPLSFDQTGPGQEQQNLFDSIQTQIANAEQKHQSAGWIAKTFSAAHAKSSADIKSHQRIIGLARSAQFSIETDSSTQLRENKSLQREKQEQLTELVYTKLRETLNTKGREIIEGQKSLYDISEDPEFFDAVRERFIAAHIDPVIDELTEENQSEERTRLLGLWRQSLIDLLSHGQNEIIGGDWNSPPEIIGNEEVRYYGHKQRIYSTLLQNTFPKDTYRTWEYVNPKDLEKIRAIDQIPFEIIVQSERGPGELVQQFTKFFADWKTKQTFQTEISPSFRPPKVQETDIYNQPRFDTEDLFDRTDSFLQFMSGAKFWNHIREGLLEQPSIKEEEIKKFEQFLYDKLFGILNHGGRESSDGSQAGAAIAKLNNLKKLPELLEYIMYAGSGHTSVNIYSYIERAASTKEGQEASQQFSPLDQDLLRQISDPDSVLNSQTRDNYYSKTGYLAKGEFFITKALLAEFFSKEANYKDIHMSELNAFLTGVMTEKEALQIMKNHRDRLEEIVFQKKDYSPWWTITGLAEELARNPEFVTRIAQDIFSQNPEMIGPAGEKIQEILKHKKFLESRSTRSAILQGLFICRTNGESGKAALFDLLKRFRGSKEDPKRLQKSLGMLEIFYKFGDQSAYNFDPSKRLGEIAKELESTQIAISTASKQDRPALQTKKRSLEVEQEKLTGLAGSVEFLQQKLTHIFAEKLHIAEEDAALFTDNIEEHLSSGLVDIAPTLLLSFESKKVEEPVLALQDIVTHIARGDFKTWKYSHDTAKEQLKFLGEEKETWIKNIDPVIYVVEGTDAASKEFEEAKRNAAKNLLKDVVTHLQESIVKTMNHFLGEDPAASITRELVIEKIPDYLVIKVHFEQMDLLLEKSPTDVAALEQLIQKMKEICLKNSWSQPANDLDQLIAPYRTANFKSLRAEEFDDPIRLIKMGTEPTETCQSWKKGMYNECLLAYVGDGDKKGLNVVDGDTNSVLLRCVERITESKVGFDGETKRSLFLEPPYYTTAHPLVFRTFAKLAIQKARSIGACVQFQKANAQPEIIEAFEVEAKAQGLQLVDTNQPSSVRLSSSINKYNYSDSFGGKLEPYGSYHEATLITIK